MNDLVFDVMPRAKRTYRLDTRILEVMDQLAKNGGQKPAKFIETTLFAMFQGMGYIAKEEQPLGETRGGDRKSLKAKTKAKQIGTTNND